MSLEDDKYEKYLKECIDCVQECGEAMNSLVTDMNVKRSFFSELESFTKAVSESDAALKRSERALQEVRNMIDSQEDNELIDIEKEYNYALSNQVEELPANQCIWSELAPKLKLYATTSNKEEDMNSSLSCSNGSPRVPMDPITKKPIKNPCKNTKCGHIYEYDSIMQYISVKKNNARCPYIGCVNTSLNKRFLEIDEHC